MKQRIIQERRKAEKYDHFTSKIMKKQLIRQVSVSL